MPVDPAAADTTVVRTRAELVAALAAATAGDTVFVDGAASINLTGLKRIPIPAGVTLASNRGQSGAAGGLLYNTELQLGDGGETWAQFLVTGAGVRVTGLRLRGPDTEIRDTAYQYDNSRGIEAVGASDLLVDRNEMWGWSHAAVYLGNTIEGRVYNNYMHHNRRTGLGYGVVLYADASALIENNTFTQNRHDIAGSGIRTQRYEARFNVTSAYAGSHAFDMHGENETQHNGQPWAGAVMHIKHNSFRSASYAGVAVRGRPSIGAWISGNCFAHGGASTATRQVHFSGNFHVGANTYGTTTGNCHQTGRRVAWQLSSGGTGSWTAVAPYTYDVSELGFGDFNGDGRTDAFRATGYRWYYSPGATGKWVGAATSNQTISGLRFGDFNGDGKTDVFTSAAGQWQYSSGAVGGWQDLATSNVPLADLRFGDFDGDGKTDVFRTDGLQWYYSSGGTSSWRALERAEMPIGSLRFGDFNGDGKTDVFTVVDGRWLISWGGASKWQEVNNSSTGLVSLRFGDFNGDGRTDVFQSSGGRWYYSSAAQSSWIAMAQSGCPVTSLHVSDDFNGDGKADVFDGRCGG
ncbi:FG-GAP-like repeat-containing protein [Phytohabitans kaempferiae]|uniref:FG-GAP-like repeat-containing protein n=1 Tax=Phytohabitans kaempferiae TaxID=1620943 RepID=A0ABV6M4W7_9ACTN